MCNLILSTVSNIDFVRLLYGDDTNQNSQERAQVFLDLYLNTPDKSLNETPLHFAAKFGAVEVVELLVMYKECDKRLVNKYGLTPNMVGLKICAKIFFNVVLIFVLFEDDLREVHGTAGS